jgi:hypothetical protein
MDWIILQDDDPRLDCAVLRPMESDGDHFLAYYLTKEDDTATEFKTARLARPINAEQDEDEEVSSPLTAWVVSDSVQATAFHFVRDYEVVRVEQEVPNEFLLVLDDGDGESEAYQGEQLTPSHPRAKGAYYKNIERKMVLKKRRINVSCRVCVLKLCIIYIFCSRMIRKRRNGISLGSNTQKCLKTKSGNAKKPQLKFLIRLIYFP